MHNPTPSASSRIHKVGSFELTCSSAGLPRAVTAHVVLQNTGTKVGFISPSLEFFAFLGLQIKRFHRSHFPLGQLLFFALNACRRHIPSLQQFVLPLERDRWLSCLA